MATVQILLAAYNGSKYIREMVDSIVAQEYRDWHLIVSDDGSDDGTQQILEEYARAMPERITHYRSGMRFGSTQGHFMHLLKTFPDGQYTMFCDQDDVWHPDKISKTLCKMQQVEGEGLPAMVHTDLRVTDARLKVMDESFMHYSKLRGDRLEVHQLMMQNVVTGCTMMINRSLAQLAAKTVPEQGILMHDWWIALVASALGRTGYVDSPTMEYRQHGDNVVGAKNTRSLGYILRKLTGGEIRRALGDTYAQAKALHDSFSHLIDQDKGELVAEYAALQDAGYVRRRIKWIRFGFYKFGLSRIAAQMLLG